MITQKKIVDKQFVLNVYAAFSRKKSACVMFDLKQANAILKSLNTTTATATTAKTVVKTQQDKKTSSDDEKII